MSELHTTSIHTTKVLDKHCMIDLETLGSNPKSPIIQIGLVIKVLKKI